MAYIAKLDYHFAQARYYRLVIVVMDTETKEDVARYLNLSVMGVIPLDAALESKNEKVIANFEATLGTVRAAQANAAVLARVSFEYYGSPTLLTTMADVRVADARTLTITPYDASTLKAMEKAILMSDVGITPANDGKVIRLVFPVLTEERRKEIVKQIKPRSVMLYSIDRETPEKQLEKLLIPELEQFAERIRANAAIHKEEFFEKVCEKRNPIISGCKSKAKIFPLSLKYCLHKILK